MNDNHPAFTPLPGWRDMTPSTPDPTFIPWEPPRRRVPTGPLPFSRPGFGLLSRTLYPYLRYLKEQEDHEKKSP